MNSDQTSLTSNIANQTRAVRFLHLSDIHVGMESQRWLWPAFKKAFLDDIRTLHRKSGPWDVVIFSGDLTQKASTGEYARLTEILQEVWALFLDLGFTPLLFPVPGNHDLTRPPDLNAHATVLGDWWNNPPLHKLFWKTTDNEYRNFLTTSFSNYHHWLQSLSESKIPTPAFRHGLLPGDISSTIEAGSVRLGLVGLNSAWLQIGDGDFKGRLHIDPLQLLAVTNDKPDEWCAENHFNLLITHHPVDWLAPKSLEGWRSEINTHARFDCHVHGHMHEPSAITISEGGAISRRSKQGASLFGLETIERIGTKRIHGYAACQILDDGGNRSLRHWPRKAHKGLDGRYKMIADPDFEIGDEGYFEEKYNLQATTFVELTPLKSEVAPHKRIANPAAILSSIRFSLPVAVGHRDVRKAEQNQGFSALKERRALWLVSDWGLGSEQFLGALQERLSIENSQIYKLDFQRFFNSTEILAGVQEQISCTFEQLCELIASQPACFLLFDEVPIAEGKDKDSKSLQSDIEKIVDILLQYCENVKLIVKSRLVPASGAIPLVQLGPFDEADTATYVAAQDHRVLSSGDPKFIEQLFRHTDGVPARIDSVLRDIQIVGTSELHRLNIDVAGKTAANVSPAPGLEVAISEMQRSPDPTVKRAFELLKVLTVFPRGELLGTIKRFNQTKPLYPQDARYLLDLALIDAVDVPSVDPINCGDGARAMLVRRPVREYLYSLLSDTELRNLNKRALNLYFGSEWSLKGIKSPKSHRFDDRSCGSWQIGNANMMVLRATREAVDSNSKTTQKAALELANAYCAALNNGDHYKGILTLCGEIIPLFESMVSFIPDLTQLLAFYGGALRMTGDYSNAYAVLNPIEGAVTGKGLRQGILLDIALSCERLEDLSAATAAAKEIIKINPKSNVALQAQALLAGRLSADADKEKKLQSIETRALAQKANVVAHNLALDRATASKDVARRKEILEWVVSSAQNSGDHYNSMRASLRLAKVILDAGGDLNMVQMNQAIGSYHYLYSDTIDSLFSSCHDILWRAFERMDERANLLRLFRYSSLIWRLRGQEKSELKYLKLLSARLGKRSSEDLSNPSRELTYFLARTSQAMILEPQ